MCVAASGDGKSTSSAADVSVRPCPQDGSDAVAPARDANLKSLIVASTHDSRLAEKSLRESVLALRPTLLAHARAEGNRSLFRLLVVVLLYPR